VRRSHLRKVEMRRRIIRPLFAILLFVFLFTSEAEARNDDILLSLGLGGLIGGSTVTLIYNSLGPPSRGWIEVGGLLGFANLPVGTTLLLAGYAFESNGIISVGSVNLALGIMNILASYEARAALDERKRILEVQRCSLDLSVTPVNPSVQISLRW